MYIYEPIMAKHNELGEKGEKMAISYLQEKGYLILETNWRTSYWEIDIIAKMDQDIVFVEVKTRSSLDFGNPEDFVTPLKQSKIFKAAEVYIESIPEECNIRFDIIAINAVNNQNVIEHFEDAFYPYDGI